jgi:hypothetical protein
LSTTSLSNTTTVLAKKDLVVTIINDGVIEGDENILINATITNLGTNPVNNFMEIIQSIIFPKTLI